MGLLLSNEPRYRQVKKRRKQDEEPLPDDPLVAVEVELMPVRFPAVRFVEQRGLPTPLVRMLEHTSIQAIELVVVLVVLVPFAPPPVALATISRFGFPHWQRLSTHCLAVEQLLNHPGESNTLYDPTSTEVEFKPRAAWAISKEITSKGRRKVIATGYD
jgi:hypothetical protein